MKRSDEQLTLTHGSLTDTFRQPQTSFSIGRVNVSAHTINMAPSVLCVHIHLQTSD